MHTLNFAPCVPPELIEYMDGVHDKVNIAFKVGHDLVGMFRDIRCAEWNTQIVTLFSSLQLTDDVILAALYLPEWNEFRSDFAVCKIISNQVVSITAPSANGDLLELDIEGVDFAVIASFTHLPGVAPRGKIAKPTPFVEWFTPSDIALEPAILYGQEPLPEPVIPVGYVDKEDKPRKPRAARKQR